MRRKIGEWQKSVYNTAFAWYTDTASERQRYGVCRAAARRKGFNVRKFVILTDSCCDLNWETACADQIEALPLSFRFGEEEYENHLDERDMSLHRFYERIRQGEMPSTAAVSVGAFEDAMRRHLRAGEDILCLSFSSGLSTTYQSAAIAAEHLKEEFPEGTIRVVDTLCASGGEGLLVTLCAQQKAQGKSLQEISDYATAMIPHLCHWFTVDDLNHLKRGGRVSSTTAMLGTMLSIKPVLRMDDKGRLESISKSRGRRQALLALVERMEKSFDPSLSRTVFINHSDCLEDAEFVKQEILRRMDADISFHPIGPVIGSHTGTGTVALFFTGTNR